MLNKVKLIGKVLPLKIKEVEEGRELEIYFSLEVPNPSVNAITILRCMARGNTAEKLKAELQEGDIVEVRGYLRNEKKKDYSLLSGSVSDEFAPSRKENRQILVKIVYFTKLDLNFEEIDKQNSNQVRLMGKIKTDFKNPEKIGPELPISKIKFKIEVPRENNPSPLFFCRVHGELVNDFNQHLNKDDIIFLEGFLQTKKEKEGRISAVICQGFTFLDSDSSSNFAPLKEFTRIFKNTIREIDFSKPKELNLTEEE